MKPSDSHAYRRSRRRQPLVERLGGKCDWCGQGESLEICRRDPSSNPKLHRDGVYRGEVWRLPEAEVEAELPNCFLLCRPCRVKHDRLLRVGHLEPEHGKTRYNYDGCRCDVCRAAKAKYTREYLRDKRQAGRSSKE